MAAWYQDYEVAFSRPTRGVKFLLLATLIGYVIQDWLLNAGLDINRLLGLSLYGLLQGQIWQLVTYMFLHGPWYHLVLNMLILFMMGPETEQAMGRNQFLTMYFVSGILGGVGWLIISAGETPLSPCIGASGAVFGIIGAFAALFPRRYITLLLFFVIPITMQARALALVLGAMELLFLLTHILGGNIANAAHLVGGIAGFLYALTVFGAVRTPADAGDSPASQNEGREGIPGGQGEEIDRIPKKMDDEGM